MSSKERGAAILDTAPIIHGKRGFAALVKLSNVWTRKKCRTCDERSPSWLFRGYKQAVEEQQFVRYESSSSDECLVTVAVQYRIAAERNKQEGDAKMDAELAG